jgi:hypothetical protein
VPNTLDTYLEEAKFALMAQCRSLVLNTLDEDGDHFHSIYGKDMSKYFKIRRKYFQQATDAIMPDYGYLYEAAYEARLRLFFQKIGLTLERNIARFDGEEEGADRPHITTSMYVPVYSTFREFRTTSIRGCAEALWGREFGRVVIEDENRAQSNSSGFSWIADEIDDEEYCDGIGGGDGLSCHVCLEMNADELMRHLISDELANYRVVRTSPEPLQI